MTVRRVQSDLTVEPLQPPAQVRPVGRGDTTRGSLTGGGVSTTSPGSARSTDVGVVPGGGVEAEGGEDVPRAALTSRGTI